MPAALSTLAQQIDTRKALLVLSPFSVQGEGDASQAIGYLQSMVLASQAALREPKNPDEIKPGADVKFVARNLDGGEGASPMSWNTEALTVSFATGGTDRKRIFIENSYSVGFKLELVQAYALGGLSISDGSAQSDVANIWPTVAEFIRTATVTLRRPNDGSLVPTWQAPDGGQISAAAGTTVTWVPDKSGQFNVILVVSDGDRRFGQKTLVEVRAGEETTTPSPLVTFAPDTDTPSPSPTAGPSPTAAGALKIEVGKIAEGSDEDTAYSNNELVEPGSEVTYLITIDNDSSVPVSVTSLVDSLYPDADCEGNGGASIIGAALAPDDGDGAGSIDGGADEIQCKFSVNAPDEAGETVVNEVVAEAQDQNGNKASDRDNTTVTTSEP
jgi:uncharacterized repeat protein (TIGR01451 family)